ncbi:MAG TPA: hypothetical protein PK523_07990 [Elusimicrobiales bacterium]|nr:hypothetical protein [Elusimicrobiales bacterium]
MFSIFFQKALFYNAFSKKYNTIYNYLLLALSLYIVPAPTALGKAQNLQKSCQLFEKAKPGDPGRKLQMATSKRP